MRELVRWIVFPACLCAGLGGAMAAFGRGVPAASVILPIFVLAVGTVAVLERWLPYRSEWNASQGDLGVDALYLPISFAVNGLLDPVVATLAVLLGGALSASGGLGAWPSDWPLLGQLALAAVIAEFFDYWAHRVLHEVPWLWRFHATHHSPRRLYWLNATRAHPLETAFRGLVGALPLALLGAGTEVLALGAVVALVAGLFQHANIDFELGPLSWIFSIGELHRWHHSATLAEANHNYGNSFIFWDAVFGTRYLPEPEVAGGGASAPRGPGRLGIEGLDAFPHGIVGHFLAPLRWHRIEAASRASGDAAR
jgi:sterol desaturase/sphingolipid hydroxylase (fatty acid hydroxylase superfamily)